MTPAEMSPRLTMAITVDATVRCSIISVFQSCDYGDALTAEFVKLRFLTMCVYSTCNTKKQEACASS
jgi:hypothetical protein